jgi:hypothetical protein
MLKTFVIPYRESSNRSTVSLNRSRLPRRLSPLEAIPPTFRDRVSLRQFRTPAVVLAFLGESGSNELNDRKLFELSISEAS